MAISRMQQPRQMYGLGSFVKKAVRKVTKPVTKIAQKIVPREVAGIMRAAAPFLPAGYREAAYLLGTAKQTGRISPMDLALTAAPTFFSKTNLGQGIADRVGNLRIPGMDRNLRQLMVGTPEITSRGPLQVDVPFTDIDGSGVRSMTLPGFGDKRTVEATSGLFGKGGEMFQLGKDGVGILDTKAGQTLFGKETDEGFKFSPLKLGSIGVSALSLIQNSKTPDEAGTALAAATGDSADYDRGYALFSQLTPELFAVPERFRMDAKGGGLMRTNYAQGSEYITKRPNFFKDLFLEREGGGGRDYMLPMEASERKDLNEVFVIGGDDMKKAEKIEAERMLPSLYDNAMLVIDAILDVDDEKTKQKMMDDVNSSFDKTKGSGLSKAANSYYRIIQKYGYLLNDKQGGLGSMQARKAQQANGGLMRTNYAIGSGDGAPKPVNPFGPKPTGPVLPEEDKPFRPKPLKPLKIASGFESFKDFIESTGDSELMELYSEFLETGDDARMMLRLKKLGYDMRDDIATGGRVGFALGTKPTPEESGLGGLPIEADMRYTGGFMPYGAKEKADDVPARLSKNEFVFTADAVRAAGGGSVNKGAKKMYQTMKQLEAKPEAKGMMA